MIRRSVSGSVDGTLGDRQVEVTLSTNQRARDGHILVPQGCVLDAYRANPIALWGHDVAEPVGTIGAIVVKPNAISARATFAPAGISSTADRVLGLAKSGVVRGISVGFDVLDAAPIDPARPRGGLLISKWELLEVSFCSVPVDTGAGVTARSLGGPRAAVPLAELSPEVAHLVTAAAQAGESLSPQRIASLCVEARQLGQTPTARFNWLRMAGRAARR